MSTATLRRVFSSLRNNPRALVDAMLRRSSPQNQINQLQQLEPRQMLSAIPDWVNTLSTTAHSQVNDVARADDGSVYAAGTFNGSFDFDPGAGVTKLTSVNEFGDGFLVKYDSKGAFVWARQFAGVAGVDSTSSFIGDISLDDDGNVYVGGDFDNKLFLDFAGSPSATTLKSNGQADFFIAKVTPAGVLDSVRHIGGKANDTFGSFISTRSDDIIFTGLTTGDLDVDPGAGTVQLGTPPATFQGFAVGFNAKFEYQNHLVIRGMDGFSFSSFASGALDPANNTLVLVATVDGASNLLDKTGAVLASFDLSNTNTSQVIFSLDTTSGIALDWSRTLTSTQGIIAGPVVLDSKGNIYNGLSYSGNLDLDPTGGVLNVIGGPSAVPAVISLDSNGAFRFGQSVNAIGEVRAMDINIDPLDPTDVTVYAVGDFTGNAVFDATSKAGNRNSSGSGSGAGSAGYVWAFDENGKFIDAAALYSAKGGSATSGGASIRGIDASFDGPGIIGGSFEGTVDFDASTGVQKITSAATVNNSNGFVASYSKNGTADTGVAAGSTHTFSQTTKYTATVPGGNKVTFSLTGAGTGTVTVSDTGELLSVLITGSTSKTSFNVAVSGKANGGTATIGSIAIGKDGDLTSDAIGAISAAKLNVAAGIIDIENSAGSLTLNNLNDVSVTIGAAAAAGTSFKLGSVLNANIMATGLISGIDLTGAWDTTVETSGHISATGIGKINVKGDFESSIMLSGVAKGNALGNVTASGVIANGNWDINGSTGIINALGANNFKLEADNVQGFGLGKSGITNSLVSIKSAGAFTIAGNVNGFDLILQAAGTSAKLLTNLASFSVAGTTNDLQVTSGNHTNLGAFTFKGSANNVQITGANNGTIAGITGTSASFFTAVGGNITAVTFSGSSNHVILTSSGKLGAVNFKGDLTQGVINLNAAPAKATPALTSLGVAGKSFQVTVNSANANASVGSLTFTKGIDIVTLNVAGDIGAIKSGAANELHINKAGKIASLSVSGDLTASTIDALAITGAFAVSGKISDLDFTLNTARSAVQPVSFKALGSMTVGGAGTGVSVTASGANSNFGAIAFKGALSSANFSTPANIAGLTGTSGASVNVDAGGLKSLAFSSDINSISVQAGTIGSFATKGALSKANIVLVNSGAKDFSALGSFSVSGATNTLSILSANLNGNLGAITLGPTVNNVLLNIGGDIASFKAGSVESLDLTSPGKVGGFTLSGNLTSSNVDVLSLGTVAIAGNATKVGITVNTDLGVQSDKFVALAGLTVSGTTSNLTLTAAGVNSNVGALTFNKGLTSGIFDIQGTATSLISKGAVTNFNGSITSLKAFTVTGNVSGSSLSSDAVGAVNVTGSIAGLNLNLNPIGSSSDTNKALGSLTVSGNAANVIISAPGLNSHLGNVDIKGDATGFQAFITGDAAKISARSFDASTVLSVAGKIASIATAKSGALDGSIAASSITAINVGGDFKADVVSLGLSGIGSVNITGNITAGSIRAQGNITSITANAILNSTILSGYDNNLAIPTTMPLSSAGFVNSTATIGTVTITSKAATDSFVNSMILGVKIGTVNLKLVDTTNAGVVIGLAATKELGPVTRTDPANPTKTIKVGKITLPAQSVQTNDFVIRILPA